VHLSGDEVTAMAVGQRHGKPVVLRVAAGAMHADGHVFTRADNGVWLVDRVPPQFLGID
jgi:putative RNA 2'-phosphotransferase